MTGQKLRLAALGARTRRMLRHSGSPVERALALVIVARVIADHAAGVTADSRSGDTVELAGAERVLTAALQHLHDVRTTSYHHGATPPTHD